MRRLPGGFFTSLLLCLDEHTFHTLTVIASGIERILPDIVAVTLKRKEHALKRQYHDLYGILHRRWNDLD